MTRPRTFLLSVALLLFSAPQPATAGAYFTYGGVDVELSDLAARFPNSRVQENTAWLSATDSREHVYHVRRVSNDDGIRWRLVLEKPTELLAREPRTWQESHYARFPPCREVLARLVARYGKPQAVRTFSEERLMHRVREWSRGDETLELDCYRVSPKGRELAAEVWLSRR